MKNLFFYGAIVGLCTVAVVSCQKQELNDLVSNENQDEVSQKHISTPYGVLEEKKRSYVWVNDKLDCSQDGSGCIVKSSYVGENGDIELDAIQVVTLIQIGNQNLNQYFASNDLSYEFPTLYTENMITKISNNALVLSFEFPYFNVADSQGNTVMAFNYESTLGNSSVLNAIQGAGSYTKKVQLNTDPNTPAVWKCTEAGDNCKVSSVKYNAQWLAENPEYMFATEESIISTEIDDEGLTKRVVIKTSESNNFAVQF